MVATVSDYTELKNRALIGSGFDGVVRVVFNGVFGTGTLLFGGQAVLTAAHLFSKSQSFTLSKNESNYSGTIAINTSVIFESISGLQSITANDVWVHPSYEVSNSLNDLALVWLSEDPPISAERYNLYRSQNELGQTFTMVGYGLPGLGSSGFIANFSQTPLRILAQNQFDIDTASIGPYFSNIGAWELIRGKQLAADFDNGLSQNDAFGQLLSKSGLGLGSAEGILSPGDSGGPGFINGQLAAVASFTARLSAFVPSNTSKKTLISEPAFSHSPDLDSTGNSSFGEVASWQRVSAYQQWIDQSLRLHDNLAPQSLSQLQKSLVEGNSGTKLVYFWVQLNGYLLDPKVAVSLDYQTRSGTAVQGQDYLEAKGTLKLYPGEDHALVAVEILGDSQPEEDEYFYLDVFNPIGASFEAGLVKLTAVRTILNDDGWLTQMGGY
jgi:hypothetical protein